MSVEGFEGGISETCDLLSFFMFFHVFMKLKLKIEIVTSCLGFTLGLPLLSACNVIGNCFASSTLLYNLCSSHLPRNVLKLNVYRLCHCHA